MFCISTFSSLEMLKLETSGEIVLETNNKHANRTEHLFKFCCLHVAKTGLGVKKPFSTDHEMLINIEIVRNKGNFMLDVIEHEINPVLSSVEHENRFIISGSVLIYISENQEEITADGGEVTEKTGDVTEKTETEEKTEQQETTEGTQKQGKV